MSNLAMMMGLGSGAGGTPWLADLSVASYDSVLLNMNSQDTVTNGITFGYDGLRMYMTGDGSKYVNQYDLTTAWDLSTASYASKRHYVGSQEGDPSGVQFKSDGTKFYLIGVNNDTVYQYSMSTAWDVSTASYDSVSFSANSQQSLAEDLFFSTDGDKLYVIGFGGVHLYQYTLSTAWDVSTASYDSISFDTSSYNASPAGIYFNPKGDKFYVAGTTIDEYTMTTNWDISTASHNATYTIANDAPTTSPHGLHFKPDGSRMFVVYPSTDTVYQFTTA